MIDYSNIDYVRREDQEDKDYQIAVDVFSGLYSGLSVNFEKCEPWTAEDMRYTATTRSNRDYIYKVEIKTRNQDMERYNDLPIKCSKLARLRKECTGIERILYFVIVNYSEWYLFDLNAIDLNKCRLDNWKIPVTQYVKDESKITYEYAPTFFIPVEQALRHGYIN